MRKTKIVCTLGPSTDDERVLRQLILAGMNVARLNFSHGTHEEQLERINAVKRLREELNVPVAILLDTKGPEIRIGTFKDKAVIVEEGQQFILTTEAVTGDETRVSVSYRGLADRLKAGDRILIDDGLIEMVVERIEKPEIVCTVKNGGRLSNTKSINLPGIDLDMPYMTQRDREDILFGIKNGIDFIAASFVRSAYDVRQVRDILKENNAEHIKIISKIENAQGVENVDEILDESNGIMVARGDMGVEIDFAELPRLQKVLIKKCYAAGKMAVTATQMLDSMMHNPRATRAEVSDVANAVYDGTSAVMLSGETAAGEYPVESLATMVKIVERTENSIHYDTRFLREKVKNTTITDALGHAACTTALDLKAKAIVTVTSSGHTARMISKFRPSIPIIAATTSKDIYNQLALSWGVVPVMNEAQLTQDNLFKSAVQTAIKTGMADKGDVLVITASDSMNLSGSSNLLKIHVVK